MVNSTGFVIEPVVSLDNPADFGGRNEREILPLAISINQNFDFFFSQSGIVLPEVFNKLQDFGINNNSSGSFWFGRMGNQT